MRKLKPEIFGAYCPRAFLKSLGTSRTFATDLQKGAVLQFSKRNVAFPPGNPERVAEEFIRCAFPTV